MLGFCTVFKGPSPVVCVATVCHVSELDASSHGILFFFSSPFFSLRQMLGQHFYPEVFLFKSGSRCIYKIGCDISVNLYLYLLTYWVIYVKYV